ncbi:MULTISPECIES: hypothetical protein [Serratia]|uniref:hypothetical protein n=1 Tax=Serratia TaxID=613 RepID=UPI00275E9608|nr:hypothetical protein [Serratia marcescens]MDP8624891.1 hypothetical protein [Serratia marcescens]MDP8674322.1 hypothetical protein [Serratia marcescens]MDP8689324.1 hypothetical protein [Serratia marcescens]MDP8699071.1 hypothetical protein [Serratia marcescens]MDP8708749.1 hypothetical protein [Serratia marcescens]
MITIKRFTPDYKMHAVRFEAFAREAEHGELVRFDAHQQVVSALEAERDAQQKRADSLAVESLGLRHIAERIVNALYAAGYEPEENSLHPWKSLIFDAEKSLNTPATDAALAAIEVRALEKFADSELCSQEAHGCVCSYIDELREAK